MWLATASTINTSILRNHVFTLLGRDSAEHADLEAAARLGGDTEDLLDGS